MAEYYEVDTIVVRILAILLAILTLGIAVIVYMVLYVCVPTAPLHEGPYDVKPESAESSAFGSVDLSAGYGAGRKHSISILARLAVAAGLMLLFLVVAMGVSPMVPGTKWWQFWPLCFLMGGLCLIIIPVRTSHEALWHFTGIVLATFSASILPMSLEIMSWSTVNRAISTLWPLVVAAIIFFAVGLIQKRDAYLFGAAFCLVLFCAMGFVFCVVPGETESLFFNSPNGRMVIIELLD